ncbi:hypothetical protein PIB30_042388 [Stylosanthes scabra]|uniref:RNase H type-1 domain-containing protein n=1 Tax=Stylosanthes scabra TaxID=79078 RepID=A0ABU6XD09_9FABA|nr:hypothetical protein [Stylosanthes scabra]
MVETIKAAVTWVGNEGLEIIRFSTRKKLGPLINWECGIMNLVIEMDSRDAYLVVQRQNLTPIDENADLLGKIHEVCCSVWKVEFSLIPREANSVSDFLAKYGVQNNMSYVKWLEPGNNLSSLLLKEAAVDQPS